jgi:hypothetical protein
MPCGTFPGKLSKPDRGAGRPPVAKRGKPDRRDDLAPQKPKPDIPDCVPSKSQHLPLPPRMTPDQGPSDA